MIPSSVPTMSGGAVSSRSLALAGMKGSKVEAACESNASQEAEPPPPL